MRRAYVLVFLIIALTVSGCSSTEREYLADIVIPLGENSGEIIIKEWRWLLGSGAEIYYQLGGKQTLLGTTTGGDDGYCPFADGKYSVYQEDDEIVIRWLFQDDNWKEKRFILP